MGAALTFTRSRLTERTGAEIAADYREIMLKLLGVDVVPCEKPKDLPQHAEPEALDEGSSERLARLLIVHIPVEHTANRARSPLSQSFIDTHRHSPTSKVNCRKAIWVHRRRQSPFISVPRIADFAENWGACSYVEKS